MKTIRLIILILITIPAYSKYKVVHVIGHRLDKSYLETVNYSVLKLKKDTSVQYVEIKYWDMFVRHAPTADYIVYTGHGGEDTKFELKQPSSYNNSSLLIS